MTHFVKKRKKKEIALFSCLLKSDSLTSYQRRGTEETPKCMTGYPFLRKEKLEPCSLEEVLGKHTRSVMGMEFGETTKPKLKKR